SMSRYSANPPATPNSIRSVRERYRRLCIAGPPKEQAEAAGVRADVELDVGRARVEPGRLPERIVDLDEAALIEIVRGDRAAPMDEDRCPRRQTHLEVAGVERQVDRAIERRQHERRLAGVHRGVQA